MMPEQSARIPQPDTGTDFSGLFIFENTPNPTFMKSLRNLDSELHLLTDFWITPFPGVNLQQNQKEYLTDPKPAWTETLSFWQRRFAIFPAGSSFSSLVEENAKHAV